jgi:hypothetical protein
LRCSAVCRRGDGTAFGSESLRLPRSCVTSLLACLDSACPALARTRTGVQVGSGRVEGPSRSVSTREHHAGRLLWPRLTSGGGRGPGLQIAPPAFASTWGYPAAAPRCPIRAQTSGTGGMERSGARTCPCSERLEGSHFPPLPRISAQSVEQPGGLEVPSSNLGAPIEKPPQKAAFCSGP